MLLYLFHALAFIYQVRVLISDNTCSGTQSLLLDCDTWRLLVTWNSAMQAAHFGLSLAEDVLRLLKGDDGTLQKCMTIKRNHYFTCYVFPQGTCVSVAASLFGRIDNPWISLSTVTVLFLELFLKAHKYPSNKIVRMTSTSVFCFISLYTIMWMGIEDQHWSLRSPNHPEVLFLLICMSCATAALYCLGEYVTSASWVMHRLLETLHNPQGLVGHNTFGIDGGPSQNRSRIPRGTALQKARVIFGNGSFSMEDTDVHLTL